VRRRLILRGFFVDFPHDSGISINYTSDIYASLKRTWGVVANEDFFFGSGA